MPPEPVFKAGVEDGVRRTKFHPFGYPTEYRYGYRKGLFEKEPWRQKVWDLGTRLQRFAESFRVPGWYK